MRGRPSVAIGFILVAALAGVLHAAPGRLSLNDLVEIRDLGDTRFSPDGSRIAYTVSWDDPKTNAATSDVWVVPVDGGAPVQLTNQPKNDHGPRWSPNGRTIAFLSDRDAIGAEGVKIEGRTEIWLMPPGGGEARQVSRSPTSITEFDWAPGGAALVYVAEAEPPDREAREKRQKAGFDEIVTGEHRMSQLFVLDVASGETKQLTSGDFHASEAAWSPRGDLIAFVSRPSPIANEALLSDLFVVPAGGGAPRRVVDNDGPDYAPAWSPDGSQLAYLSNRRRQSSGAHSMVMVTDVGGGTSREVLQGFEYSAGPPRWSGDGGTLYFATGVKTESHVFAVAASGGTPRALTSGMALDGDFDVSRDGKRMAYARQDPRRPADLWSSGIDGAAPAKLTDVNPGIADASVASSEVIRWKGADDWEVEGVLVKPLDYRPGQRYPLIVEAHGGPHGRQSVGFDPLWQLFAANGFMVLAPNFRGSGGYSQAFVDSDRNDWGGKDYTDIMNGVDHLVAAGLADPDRLGIEGWSYGGFMTSWIIGHTDRFKAAVAGAPVTNLFSFYGTTDIQRFIEWEYMGFPWDHLESIRAHSPITYAPRATTPTLILQGDADLRVPPEQGFQLYTTLKKVGTPVEYVRYPREGHGLREPAHKRDRYERTLGWLERYLTPRSSN
jgi:dipeptidyl aminopeptidase/acylaminoacyl peptidase